MFNFLIYGFRLALTLLIVVFHFHFNFQNFEYPPIVDKFYLAVDCFFVISGYLISKHITKYETTTDFIISRALKLIPLHWLGIVFILSIYICRYLAIKILDISVSASETLFIYPNDTPHLIIDFLVLNGIGLMDSLSWNYPSWCISTEIFLYIIYSYSIRMKRNISIAIFLFSLIVILRFPTLNIVTHSDDRIIFSTLFRGILGFYFGHLFSNSNHLNRIILIGLPLITSHFNADTIIYIIPLLMIHLSEFKTLETRNNNLYTKLNMVNFYIYITHAGCIMITDIITRRVNTNNSIVIFIFVMIVSIFIFHKIHKKVENYVAKKYIK